jgi:serine/threonine-protein kinase RsbW
MATVELSFTPLPAHVRTARLVATAVARRSGVAEALLDEVRLAVGEACSRAVEAHRRSCPGEPVRLALTDQAGRFQVEVTETGTAAAAGTDGPGGTDWPAATAAPAGTAAGSAATAGSTAGSSAAGSAAAGTAGSAAAGTAGSAAAGTAGSAAAGTAAAAGIASLPHALGDAVIAGLADDVEIRETDAGTSIRMSWPSAGERA